MIATSTFALSPKGRDTQANARTVKASPVARLEAETTGANFSLTKDLWETPPSNAELTHTIGVVAGLLAMFLAAFGLIIAVFGV